MLTANPKPAFDIFSYHHYGAASQRCAAIGAGAQTTADAALSEEWLSRTDRSYDALPEFQPTRIASGRVTLAPTTISFLVIPDAGNAACR